MSDMTDELREALLNAVIFDKRDNIKHEAGRAAETARLIRDAVKAHQHCSTITDEQVEAAAEAMWGGAELQWSNDDETMDMLRGMWRRKARRALEAAAQVRAEEQ